MPRVRKERKESKPKVKKALSAFMFFNKDARQKLKEEQPDATFGEIGKIIGQRWKDLAESEKQPYLKQAQRDKERYESELLHGRKEE